MTYFVIVRDPDSFGKGELVFSPTRSWSVSMWAYSPEGLCLADAAAGRLRTLHKGSTFEVRCFNYRVGQFQPMPRGWRQ